MKKAIRISDSEWAVMTVVWERAPIAAAAIAESLEKSKGWTLTTVRTLLRRLVDKGALSQEEDGKRYLYRPAVSMQECVKRESESFLDRVLGRAPGSALVHLVREAKLSQEEIEELRQILRQKEK
jgi:BlaI family transcriptional regulator, penicillinase repressor